MANELIPDLAKQHHPISDFIQWPDTPQAWERYKLSKHQLQQFEEEGYIANVPMLDDEQVEQLREELSALADPAHPGNHLFYEYHSNESADAHTVLFHALGAWRIMPGFHDVLWTPAFVMAASQLFGGRAVRFWHDQLFCKPAHHGGVVAWHQDYSYWTRTGPIQHLTCWVALDDATEENGCLQYVPGSHRWGLLQKPELAGNMDGIMDYLNDAQKQAFKPIPVAVRAGHATFHHPLLLHGSYENKSPRSRRAFVLNAFADGTCSNTDESLLQGTPAVGKGAKMEGTFYPLLFDPVDYK